MYCITSTYFILHVHVCCSSSESFPLSFALFSFFSPPPLFPPFPLGIVPASGGGGDTCTFLLPTLLLSHHSSIVLDHDVPIPIVFTVPPPPSSRSTYHATCGCNHSPLPRPRVSADPRKSAYLGLIIFSSLLLGPPEHSSALPPQHQHQH